MIRFAAFGLLAMQIAPDRKPEIFVIASAALLLYYVALRIYLRRIAR